MAQNNAVPEACAKKWVTIGLKEMHHGETKHPEMWRFNPNSTNPVKSYQHPTHLQASGSDRLKGNAPW